MAENEGAQVLKAFDGPKVEHDALIDQINARTAEEHERSSDASESSNKVTTFLESTGLNSQAFSWLKAIVKKLPKKDGQAKAMDIIRSLEVGLPMIKNHVGGQGTGEMDLDGPQDEPASDEPAPDLDTVIADGEPDADPETQELNDAVDDVVTPINFGGQAG